MKLSDKILNILEAHPQTQDDDILLYGYILQDYYNFNCRDKSAADLLRAMTTKAVPSMTAISRARRSVQENHDHVRGQGYLARQRKAEQYRLNQIPFK